MKDYFCMAIGAIGGVIAGLFGGWDAAMQTLVIFMAVDYITGLIVAGVFHASPKTKTGTLESRAGWKGLIRKGETLLIVHTRPRLPRRRRCCPASLRKRACWVFCASFTASSAHRICAERGCRRR